MAVHRCTVGMYIKGLLKIAFKHLSILTWEKLELSDCANHARGRNKRNENIMQGFDKILEDRKEERRKKRPRIVVE